MQCVADEACLPWEAGDARHLPICRDAASWDSRHDIVDTAMQTFGRSGPHDPTSADGNHEIGTLSGIMRTEIPEASTRSESRVRTIRSIAVSHPGQRRTTPIPCP